MRLLVLDDDPARHDVFERRYAADNTVVHAYTAGQALEQLQADYFDRASLDHDLGSGWPNGQEFVERMITQISPSHWPREITVHSHDSVGGLRMTERLRGAGIPSRYVPFRS